MSSWELFLSVELVLLVLVLMVFAVCELWKMTTLRKKQLGVKWHTCEYCGTVSVSDNPQAYRRCTVCQCLSKED